jgi:hypothetical protein
VAWRAGAHWFSLMRLNLHCSILFDLVLTGQGLGVTLLLWRRSNGSGHESI